jgi:nitrate/TMAO reductase-like tetraheme cytochrome c subunit
MKSGRALVQNYRYCLLTISTIFFAVTLLTRCIGNNESDKTKSGTAKQFAGSSSCISCHKDIYEKHLKTAHYLSSQPATEKNILGSFESGKNAFAFNPFSKVVMEKRGDSLLQVEYENDVQKKARPFSITVGSGKRGQTYLYWFKNNLGELPISYFTSAGQWSNSPGYGHKLVFNRPVTSRCLECHSTNFETISAPGVEPEQFSHNQVIYGVDCEKCHGAAEQHVAFQTGNPAIKTAKYIIDPKTFSRKQSLDMCTLCHGGRLTKTQPSFSFQPGDKLEDYFAIDTAEKDANDIDVHGNQYGLLAASQCFKNSQLTCTTCHSPHENETGKLAVFSQRCITCHNNENGKGHGKVCKLASSIGQAINNNCIDCHMPEQPSKAIAMLLQGNEVPAKALMRSHFIKIYPEATRQFFQKSNNLKKAIDD